MAREVLAHFHAEGGEQFRALDRTAAGAGAPNRYALAIGLALEAAARDGHEGARAAADALSDRWAARREEAIRAEISRVLALRAATLEAEIVEAIGLQDFDRIDDLHVVTIQGHPEIPDAVASTWAADVPWEHRRDVHVDRLS